MFCKTTFPAKNRPEHVIVYIRFLPTELCASRLGWTDDELLVYIGIIIGIIIGILAIIIYLYSTIIIVVSAHKTSDCRSPITIAFKLELQNRKFFDE